MELLLVPTAATLLLLGIELFDAIIARLLLRATFPFRSRAHEEPRLDIPTSATFEPTLPYDRAA